MFILGFFAGLLFLLIIDLIAGIYLKNKSKKEYVKDIKKFS